jgi:dihydroxyacetone kinase-like predicted kinase
VEIQTIDASLLAKMFLAGAKNLESQKELINELNVFPVPDGDTGTNMTMTIMSAANAVSALDNADMKTVAKAISSGSLRGARGNSGVILSQLFRGLTKIMSNYDEVNVEILAEAFDKACKTAYKAVMQPKEGTILTVAKGAADKAAEMATKTTDIVEFSEAVIAEAKAVLAKTPDMLPVLKQAGVVDSGGQGLVCVLEGAYNALIGKEIDYTVATEVVKPEVKKAVYTVEFTVESEAPLASYQLKELKAKLEKLSVGTVSDVTITEEGSDKPVIEEKKEEEKPAFTEPAKEMGFVSIATGEGLTNIFTELGCDYMIPGGQTMNPSTDDILSAVEKVNAKTVFVLPNNKNIILAANQAAAICEDKKIVVIPTKTIPQGITALISFAADASVEENEAAMTEEIANVKTGQVTYAVRDTNIDGKEIRKEDWMGMGDKGLLSVNADITVAFNEMIDEMVSEDSSVVSIYWGEGSDQAKAEALGAKVQEKYPDLEVEISEGGQAVYAYIVSVE